ncbi:hypothetical protein HFD88_000475 [Aspergillus terreus]|nr:hypothetical protein HFD88_000475 [Aspergillus terreus]
MGRTSLAHEMKGSPAPSTRSSTPSTTRRSSSRASRKATQEPDSASLQQSRTAYSLPSTPITSSFEDAASSKLRSRRRSLSYSEKPSDPNARTGTSGLRHAADLSDVPSSVSKKRRSRTRDTANGDAASTTASDISRAPTPTSSAAISNGQPEQPRSTIVRLKHRGAAASQTGRTDPAQSGLKSKEPSPAPSSASTRRRPRQSMPENINGTRSGTSTPRSATPQSSRKDWEPMAVSQQAMDSSTTPHPKPPPTAATSSVSRMAKNNALERVNLTTPAEKTSRSTPNNRSSTRTRRRNRQSTTTATPASSDKGKEASQTATVSDGADSHKAGPASKGSTDAESTKKPRKSNMVTLTLSRKALESVLSKPKPMEQVSYSPEIADSVEATPVHLYDNSFHFDYDTEMYRNNYGLDGQMDPPASPTSFSTTTSAAARTSGRTRKPTIRALESFESEKKFRRNRTRTPRPSGEGTQSQSSNTAKSTQLSDTASGQPTPAPSGQQLDVIDLARRLIEMASTAIQTNSPPNKKAETWLKELREKYRREKERGEPTSVAGDAGKAGGESMPSPPNHPSTVGNASSSWTDKDGWTHAGQFNEFGEELLGIPVGYTWVRPNNTYGDDALPQPPIRLKSCEQIEKDKIYGFPPRIGERNLPRDMDSPFFVEDVDEEKAKIKAREEARKRGIATNRSMSVGDIEALIAQHDSPASPQASNMRSEAKHRKDAKPKASRKRRRRTDPVIEENLNGSVPETPDESRPKRRRKTVTGPAASSPAPQPTPASKLNPTPRSQKRVKDGKQSKPGSEAGEKTAAEPPKTKERKPASQLKIKERKTVAETPKTKPSKDMSGSTKVKVPKNAPVPPSEHKTGGSAANDAEAPKKRRRRRNKPLVKLRILPPKKEEQNGANEGGGHAKESKKRPHSEVESGSTEERARKSPKLDEPKPWPRKIKIKRPSPETNKPKPDEGKPNGAPSTPETPLAIRENPSAGESHQNETPSGRPRRAAAAAMMAGSKQSAEERARKARRRSRKSTGKEVNGPDPGTPVSTRDE